MTKLADVLRDSLDAVIAAEGPELDPEKLAAELGRRLLEAGLTIHALDGRCVRPRWPRVEDLGREMTFAEIEMLSPDLDPEPTDD